MELTWLVQQGGRDVVIFMLGWASTPNTVCHIHPPGYDVLAVSNYTELRPLRAADFAAYRRIYLVAWSFGVWVAEQCCRELPLHRAIALNGTPFPTDERYGMRLRAALRAMKMAARSGRPPAAQPAMPAGQFPERSADEKVAELERLAEWSRQRSGAHLTWHTAYIADRDEIYPSENMWAYWQTVGLGTGVSGGHYPFADTALILQELSL